MLKFGFTITVMVINAVVNDPVGMRLRVDINTRDDTDALDDSLFGTTALSANGLNLFRIRLWEHGIVKKQVAIFI